MAIPRNLANFANQLDVSGFKLGSASTPSITFTGDTNTGIFSPAADTIAFSEGGVESMRIDSSGNVGIGVTPSAWSTVPAIQVSTYGGLSAGGGYTRLSSNAYLSTWPTTWSYINTNTASLYEQAGGSHIWSNAASGTAGNTIAFSERMRIDSSGNVQIGTSSGSFTNGSGLIIANSTSARLKLADSDSGVGAADGFELIAAGSDSYVYNYENGFMSFGTAATERMRISSSGAVSIGTTTSYGQLYVSSSTTGAIGINGDTRGGSIAVRRNGVTTGIVGNLGTILGTTDEGLGFFAETGLDMRFFVNGTATDRARINSSGFFKASNTGAYVGSTAAYHELRSNATDNWLGIFSNSSASPYGINIYFLGATPNNTTNTFLYCEDSTNQKLQIYSTGTVINRTGSYTSYSDIKIKQDIVDASSQWDDIKNLRVRKFRLKDEVAADPNYPSYIGLIAQEVEQVSPGLVDDCPDFETNEDGERIATGTVTKSVKYSILYMKAVKALQEAMLRIELSETELTKLKAELDAVKSELQTLKGN